METRERFIDITNVEFKDNHIVISWVAHIGFGILTIYKTDKGFEIDTECLGEEFYKDVLDKFKEYLSTNSKILD